jgi:hypothetical protein
MNGKVNFGGLSAEPEVKKLIEKFGAPPPGVITHTDIEAVIGCTRKTSRYRTITTSWRKRLRREYLIDTEAETGIGIRILTEPERVDASAGNFRRGTRQNGKGWIRAKMIRPELLDSTNLRRYDFLLIAGAKIMAGATAGVKELTTGFKSIAQMPRRVG